MESTAPAVARSRSGSGSSWALVGHLEDPLANPIAVVPALVTNLLWGPVAGCSRGCCVHSPSYRPLMI